MLLFFHSGDRRRYSLGCKHGQLGVFSRNQLEPCREKHLPADDVPDHIITVWEAARAQSGGKRQCFCFNVYVLNCVQGAESVFVPRCCALVVATTVRPEQYIVITYRSFLSYVNKKSRSLYEIRRNYFVIIPLRQRNEANKYIATSGAKQRQ